MYAIIEFSGKQFKVQENDVIDVDLQKDFDEGAEITFDKVLLIKDDADLKVGKPTIDAATVAGKVLGNIKGEKLVVQKFRRRKNSSSRTGHRQKYTQVKISKING